MDISADSICTGSADHGLRIYDLNSGKFRRELFSKQYGHKEWVTTCAYTRDGRIVSGGMDNQICVWAKGAVRCDTLSGHQASISKVLVDENNVCLSASYDCVINVWDLDRLDNGAQLKGPHRNAVLDMAWRNSLVVSGDKDGVVAFWDLNSGKAFKKVQAHGGGVASILLYTDNVDTHLICTSGINDGLLNVFDMRNNKPAFSQKIHGGAINQVISDMSGNSREF